MSESSEVSDTHWKGMSAFWRFSIIKNLLSFNFAVFFNVSLFSSQLPIKFNSCYAISSPWNTSDTSRRNVISSLIEIVSHSMSPFNDKKLTILFMSSMKRENIIPPTTTEWKVTTFFERQWEQTKHKHQLKQTIFFLSQTMKRLNIW